MQISNLQTIDQKYWSGLTKDNHFGYLYDLEPQLVSPVIDLLYKMNIGSDDIVSFMKKYPVMYVNDDTTPYEWLLQGSDERSVPLVDAVDNLTSLNSYSTGAATGAGAALATFYMIFAERYFEITSEIVGPRPDIYRMRIIGEPVPVGTNIAYPVQLMVNDYVSFVPADILAKGTKWSSDFGSVEQTLSKRGNSIHHTAPFRMRNTLSMIRKNYEVPGNMIRKGDGAKNCPLYFAFKDENGKIQTRWIDKLGWDFYVQCRRDIAKLLLYGRSNLFADGTYKHLGESGHEIRQGHGLYAQVANANTHYYNSFTIDGLVNFAQSILFNKVAEDQRKLVLSTGQYGMIQFHKAMEDKVAQVTFLDQQARMKMNGNEMTFGGVWTGYKTVQGIEFYLMYDPMKDNLVRFGNQMHPDGGPVSSYEYDIWDFGTSNGEPNIQRASLKGDEEIYRYLPGFRDPFSPYNNKTTPGMAVSSVDGYKVDWGFIGGIRVKNPMRTGRYLPLVSITG